MRGPSMRPLRSSLLILAVLAGLLLMVRASIASLHRTHGASDAPTLLFGQVFLVNRAAYGLRLPGSSSAFWGYALPRTGELVLFEVPDRGFLATKRVVALPGDIVELRENHLIVKGRSVSYAPVERSPFSQLAAVNVVGESVELEHLDGAPHWITFTAGESPLANRPPVRVAAGHYFLLGDNRDHSLDSREFGPVPRESILGRVVLGLSRALRKS